MALDPVTKERAAWDGSIQDPDRDVRQFFAEFAQVVYEGPDGPRYYPGTLSAEDAKRIAAEKRAAGIAATAVAIATVMPRPDRFIRGESLGKYYVREFGEEYEANPKDPIPRGRSLLNFTMKSILPDDSSAS